MNITIIGDSIPLPRPHRIREYQPAERDLAVHFKQTYGVLLQQSLQKKFRDCDILISNRAQRAYTIKHIYNELSDHLYFFEPDVLIMQVGIVDCWFRDELQGKQHVPLAEFAHLYENLLIHMGRRPETKLIVIGVCPTSRKMEARYPGILEEIKRYNDVLKKGEDHNRIFFIDMASHVSPDNPHQYLLPDDHHLNPDGQALVYRETSCRIEAFIHYSQGCKAFESGDKDSAYSSFVLSYQAYPKYVDNIYNLIGMAMERHDVKMVEELVGVIRLHELKDGELNQLLRLGGFQPV